MKEIILPQIVTIGIFNSQITRKNQTVSKKRKTTMFELELPIIDGGTAFVDDEVNPITENTVICIKPGQSRHTRFPLKCYYAHVVVTKGSIFDTLSSLPNFIPVVNKEEIKNIFSSLYEHYISGTESDDILIQSLVLKLVYLLNKNAQRNAKTIKNSNRLQVIEDTIKYVNEHLCEDLSLEKLASKAGFNAIYFHKLFKAATRKRLHAFVEEQRVKKSINLLISTDMTLTQIAYECGFSSQSYFSYAFKRRMKQTPRQYAKTISVKYNE
jgi:AraC-like DNA-binding protein